MNRSLGGAILTGFTAGLAIMAMLSWAYKFGAREERWHAESELVVPMIAAPVPPCACPEAPQVPVASCPSTEPAYDAGVEVGYAQGRADYRSGWVVAPRP